MPNTPRSWIGRTNYRLTAIEFVPYEDLPDTIKARRKIKLAWYKCLCECGNIVYIASSSIKYTKSCGCLAKEVSAKNGKNCGTKQKDRNRYLAGRIYESSKQGAKVRGLAYEISKDDIYEMLHLPCVYCGVVDSNTHNAPRRNRKEVLKYNGIDRVDPSLGYIKDNIVPCCGKCNTAKLDMSISDFKEWVMKVYKHMYVDAT